MPYTKCPICGVISHLSVGDVQQWYEERYPGIRPGELVPARCYHCWPELEAGMRIIVRPTREEKLSSEDAAGVIEQVVCAPDDGTIYRVRLESGKEAYFVRAELQKEREGEV